MARKRSLGLRFFFAQGVIEFCLRDIALNSEVNMTRNQHAPMQGILGSLAVAAFLATAAYAKDQGPPEVAPPAKAKAFEDSSYTDTGKFFRWTRGGRDPSLPSPFSGIFIEAAGGYAWNSLRDGNINFDAQDTQTRGMYTTYNSLKNQSPTIGRFSLGLGYTLPYNTNLTIVGSYSTDQKVASTTKLKNVFDVRFQPGYYIVPAHMLVYASVGYAWARVSDPGYTKIDTSNSVRLDRRADGNVAENSLSNVPRNTINPFGVVDKTTLNGLVLGTGLKFSPVGKFYLGLDYSYIKYRKKTYSGDSVGAGDPFRYTWTRNIEPRSSTVLLTLGYYFF